MHTYTHTHTHTHTHTTHACMHTYIHTYTQADNFVLLVTYAQCKLEVNGHSVEIPTRCSFVIEFIYYSKVFLKAQHVEPLKNLWNNK